jgi:hypothetical protein
MADVKVSGTIASRIVCKPDPHDVRDCVFCEAAATIVLLKEAVRWFREQSGLSGPDWFEEQADG